MTFKTIKRILPITLVTLLLSSLSLVAYGQQTGSSAVQLPKAVRTNVDTLATIRRSGELKVGVSIFAPWVMRDEQGELMGYEIEIAEKLAEDLGVDLKVQQVGFAEILGDLNQGQFDIIITGMYATPERALVVNFTEPLNYSHIELISNTEKNRGRNTISDFNKSDITVGFVSGTVYGEYAKDHFPAAKTKTYDVEIDLITALNNGEINAGIVSTPVPDFASKLTKGKVKRVLKDPLGRLGESFAIRRGDTDFLAYLNTWIRFYRGSTWLKDEYKKWFVDLTWLKDVSGNAGKTSGAGLDGKWRWTSIETPVKSIDVKNPAKYTIEFAADNTVRVIADCNRGTGTYKVDGRSLKFSPIATTRMACPAGSQDGMYLASLNAARIYKLDQDTLYVDLFADGGTMKFVRY
jgi:polar amino acid transport system substrate-binding protein